MASNIEVRPFTYADHAGVSLLWDEVFPNDPPWNNPVELIRRKLAVQPHLFFVAHTNGRIVGTVLAGFDGVRGWVYHLAVHPGARRKGIASNLMKMAEEALRNLGCPKVNLQVRVENAAAVAFYRTLGYETGRPHEHGEAADSAGREGKKGLARPSSHLSVEGEIPAALRRGCERVLRQIQV
jgi:ribosomal protein S18 acetylase RimI-like enzyme